MHTLRHDRRVEEEVVRPADGPYWRLSKQKSLLRLTKYSPEGYTTRVRLSTDGGIVGDKVYGQYCGLAKALDLVGERWTLLIIRELYFGPRRFSDLVEGLPGISTAVLTERLNRLEDARLIIHRTLPPPAASNVYALTEGGQELGRAIVPLAAWGVRILAANRRKRTEAFHPAWGLLFLRETFDASSARGVHDVYEFHIDSSVISVIVDDGEMQVINGQSGRPVDVEIHVDATTFIDVGVGRLRGREAIRRGKLRLVGRK